ncbi:unnamed protein product [Brassicogethes aeneus]|uniref:Uncharacterized protein n=1 Tax=Brassicogethes aeneus TaxID=1431903 RepID=A0A9P0AYV9_BRAAE|nr:unnamed protein product [Brassicogethes aeneus]
MISDIKINIWPILTDAVMGRIEILLGTEAITQPGLTLVVRQGKAMLLEEESPNKWMSTFGMPEVEEDKYVIRLAEKLCCESFASEMVKVDVSANQGGDFVMVDKVVTTEHGYLMIHGQLEAGNGEPVAEGDQSHKNGDSLEKGACLVSIGVRRREGGQD